MATTALTQVTRIRQFIRDWPQIDLLTAILSSTSALTATVADATIYQGNWVVQIDQEAMVVASGSGTTLTFKQRGARGTTAATHASGAVVSLQPRFLDQELLDAFNAGIDACYPYIYKDVADTSLTILSDTYEYTVPQVNSAYIPRIWRLEVLTPGDAAYRRVEDWTVTRGSTPKIKFKSVPYPGSTLRVRGYAPFPHLAFTDSMDALWPASADFLPRLYAASELLASGEAGRVRQTSGAVDSREQANRTGASSAAGRDVYQRFKDALLNGGHLPPMQAHTVVTY